MATSETHWPNLHGDVEMVHGVTEWTNEHLDYKTNEYGIFLQRTDIMPRAVAAANHILDYLIFELACRDGVHDITRLEDESCTTS